MPLSEADVQDLDLLQRQQVIMQWGEQQHDSHVRDLVLTPHGDILNDFAIHKGVWNPAIVSAMLHAGYLFYNNGRLFEGKKAIDIGTGTGLMGVVMGTRGAAKVVLSDISSLAVANAEENVGKFGLSDIASVVQGDLFENVTEAADVITFMNPYFSNIPPTGDTISASMLAPGELMGKFLCEAPRYLNGGGVIVMPSYSLAGEINNPAIQGLKHGYRVETTFSTVSKFGLQRGKLQIHELRR